MTTYIFSFLKAASIGILFTITTSAFAGMMGFPTLDDYQERAFQYGVKLTIPDFPTTVEELQSTEASILADLETLGDSIANLETDKLSFDNTFVALDLGVAALYNRVLAINIIKNTNHDPELRNAASDTMKHFDEAMIEFKFREDVYLNLRAFADDQPALEGEDKRLFEDILLQYKRLGYDLPIEERARVEALNKKIRNLGTEFADNLRECNESILFTKDQLDGLPDTFLESIKNVEGEYEVLTNVRNHVMAVQTYATSEAIRKEVFTKYNQRAMDENIDLMAELVRTRNELAKALGYETWADYVTETRMAGSGQRAVDFLEDLVVKLEPKFQAELAELAAIKANETGDPDASINFWDIRYFQEKLNQERFNLDTEVLRQYFPYEKCVQGLFEVYETVFDIQIDEIENPTLWDPSVALYIVSDVQTEKPLGLFYIDPFPREGKYNHFAQFDIVTPGILADGSYQRPTVALICNFSPPGVNQPALLDYDQVNTLFHEFGHCMHNILTEAHYPRFAGTNVPRDFVEAPSQVMEYWLEDQQVLDLFAAHWQDQSKKLPMDIVEKLNEANRAQAGWFYRRQLLFGLADLTLHHQKDVSEIAEHVAEVTNDIAERVFLPYPENTAFIATFGHIADGYDAGYYGYAWADVIAADLASMFKKAEEGFMDTEIGMRLRREIFEPGNSRDVNESVESFLGRKPNNKAFIESLGLEFEKES